MPINNIIFFLLAKLGEIIGTDLERSLGPLGTLEVPSLDVDMSAR